MIEPKKHIKKLYRTPPEFEERIGKIVRLDRNERTTPFPEEKLKEILESITPEEVVAYPQLDQFYNKMCEWLKVNRNQLLLTAGSDTGIRTVYEVYVGESDEVVMLTPTYGMYPVYCEMFGASKKEISYNEDFSLPIKRIIDAINQKTKLVIIANPNHTGTAIPERDLIDIVNAARDNNALVLIDEAYYHFYNGTILPYVNDVDNLIITRTFSKAFGIAPLRIGYLISNEEIISQLYKVKLTHEITCISARFGEYLLDHTEIMEEYVREVKAGIEYLTRELNKLEIDVPETCTNFLFAKLPSHIDATKVIELLKKKRYYINGPFSKVPIKGMVRITVGPVEQMRGFMSAFKEIYETISPT